MRVTICTFGSRGDTQPYVALALGLQQAGHTVTLVASASPEVAGWIRSYGIQTENGVARAVEIIEQHGADRS